MRISKVLGLCYKCMIKFIIKVLGKKHLANRNNLNYNLKANYG